MHTILHTTGSENKPHTQNTSNQHSAGTKYRIPCSSLEIAWHSHTVAVKCAYYVAICYGSEGMDIRNKYHYVKILWDYF